MNSCTMLGMSLLIRILSALVFLAAFAVGWHYAVADIYVEGLDIDFAWMAQAGMKLAPIGALVVAIGILAKHPFTALGGLVAIALGTSGVWLFETTLRPASVAQREAEQITYQNNIYIAGAIQAIPCPLGWQLLLVADPQFHNTATAQLILLPNNLNQPAVTLAKTDFRGILQEVPASLSQNTRTIRDSCKDPENGDTYKTLLQRF